MNERTKAVGVVEFDVDVRLQDLYSVYFTVMLRKALYLFTRVPISVVLLMGITSGDFAFVPYLLAFPWPYVFALLLIYTLFAKPLLVARSLLRKDLYRFGSVHYIIDDQGIQQQRQYSQSTIQWPAVQKVSETARVLILSLGTYSTIILPKRCLRDSDQLSILRTIINNRLQPQPASSA
jgi:YcxB-like protein